MRPFCLVREVAHVAKVVFLAAVSDGGQVAVPAGGTWHRLDLTRQPFAPQPGVQLAVSQVVGKLQVDATISHRSDQRPQRFRHVLVRQLVRVDGLDTVIRQLVPR